MGSFTNSPLCRGPLGPWLSALRGPLGPWLSALRGPLGPWLSALRGAARALALRSAGGRSGPGSPCREEDRGPDCKDHHYGEGEQQTIDELPLAIRSGQGLDIRRAGEGDN